jgi:hypothetical protein
MERGEGALWPAEAVVCCRPDTCRSGGGGKKLPVGEVGVPKHDGAELELGINVMCGPTAFPANSAADLRQHESWMLPIRHVAHDGLAMAAGEEMDRVSGRIASN